MKPASLPLLWSSGTLPLYWYLTHDSYSANMTWRDEWILPVTHAGILRLAFDLVFSVAGRIYSGCQVMSVLHLVYLLYSFIPSAITWVLWWTSCWSLFFHTFPLLIFFFFLCIATRAVLTQRPGDGDDDDDWYLLNTYCGRHSSYVLICIILLNLCNNLWGRYCYYPYFTSKTKDQRGKHLPEITQLNDRIGILIQPNSRVQALTTVHPPAKTS